MPAGPVIFHVSVEALARSSVFTRMASCKISDPNPLHRRKTEPGPSPGLCPWFNALVPPEAIAVLVLEKSFFVINSTLILPGRSMVVDECLPA
jgi:hypothetical protein